MDFFMKYNLKNTTFKNPFKKLAFDLSLEHLDLTNEMISFEQQNRDISSNLDRQEWLKEYRSESDIFFQRWSWSTHINLQSL